MGWKWYSWCALFIILLGMTLVGNNTLGPSMGWVFVLIGSGLYLIGLKMDEANLKKSKKSKGIAYYIYLVLFVLSIIILLMDIFLLLI